MARGRGGHGGTGGRGGREGRGRRLHNIVTTSVMSDSTTNANDNATSLENENVTNSGSQSNNDNLQNDPPLRDERTKLHVVNKMLDNSSTCSRVITKIFKEKIDAEGYIWTKVSQETKDFYFREFKKLFVWDPVSEKQIREAWNNKAAQRYNDLMRDIRGKMAKPGYITDDAWTKFIAYWELPKYKERQEINRENRRKGERSSTHTGGSISFAEHAKKLEAILGHPPTEFEIFLYTHTKEHDNLTFINARSKEINDNMLRLREKHVVNHEPGEVGSQGIDESTLFYEAIGGKRTNRVYGNGSNAFNLLNPNSNVNATISKQDGTSGNKELDLKMEKKFKKLTKENNSLKQTLQLLCERVGIPIPEFDSDSETEDNGEESERDSHQQHTSHSEAGATHGH